MHGLLPLLVSRNGRAHEDCAFHIGQHGNSGVFGVENSSLVYFFLAFGGETHEKNDL